MTEASVALVSMPFHVCAMPPIGLGLLRAALNRAGITARVYNFNLALLPYLATDLQEAAAIHDDISTTWDCLPGEWLFTRYQSEFADRGYLQRLSDAMPERTVAVQALKRLRPYAEQFIRDCAWTIRRGGHDIVGFTSSFMQTQPAIAVARQLKAADPHCRILFGGSNAFGEMGTALLEQWPEIDVVAHGEADLTIAPLVRALRGDGALSAIRGISYRRDGVIADQSHDDVMPRMDDLPTPDYSDYYRDLASLERISGQKLALPQFVPIETARGCWWGAKSHCTFCGLNADRMAFRSKSPAVAVHEFLTLWERHHNPNFFAVDNIIDHAYFDTVLKDLAAREQRFYIHYELKANLRRDQLQSLRAAGVMKVQPGIESLSSTILRLMRKGITAIQNVQTLKWMTELGLVPTWFILYGFPGESLAPYEETAALLPKLFHLMPPADLAPVYIERFSPYQTHPAQFGIRITGPTNWYREAFPEVPPERLGRLAYRFDYEEPGRDPIINQFVETTVAALVSRWRSSFSASGPTLGIVHGADESAVVCGPLRDPERVIRVDGAVRLVLTQAEGITTESKIMEAFSRPDRREGDAPDSLSRDEYSRFLRGAGGLIVDHRASQLAGSPLLLDTLDSSGLIMRESGRVLALPVNWTAAVRESAVRPFRPQVAAGAVGRTHAESSW